MAFALAVISSPAYATIVLKGSASGSNTGIPGDGTAGVLTISRPAAAKPGMAMIVSIAARPSQMTWTVPSGWTQLSVAAEQVNGGSSTDPGGMTMKTFWRIVGTAEPTSYSWTFANTIGISTAYCTSPNPPTYSNCSAGGSAVGGMLVFSGLDTSSTPIDGTPTSKLMNTSTLTFSTNPVTTTTANAVVVSMISYLSAGSFVYSGTSCGTTEVMDVSTPVAANAVGTTLQMGYFTKATAGVSCAPQSTANGNSDSGIGHLLALKSSARDLSLDMARDVPLSQGGTAKYTLTITNEGSLQEPGPLTIIDTLPTGLTLNSYSGTNWSCSGTTTVICTLIGTLNAGVSATPLVLTVNVSPSATGVITNTATASGTGGDSNSANDTDTDTYVILPTALVYYKFDEAANAISFAESGGGASGTATGGVAKATGNPPPTVGAALSGNPGTCGSVQIPTGTGAFGVDTGVNVKTAVGNAGTIAFWYAGSTAWNDGLTRVLLDASADLGTNTQDRHFFLLKDGTGKLVFSLKDSAGTVSTATSASFSYPASAWHHIVLTWDVAASSINIYVDGNSAAAASSAIALNGTLGTLATLYLGAQRMVGVGGGPTSYLATPMNTAYGYLDEVRIYNTAFAPLAIPSVYALTHACAATVDHFELSLPSTASACLPVVPKVTACADTSSPCTNGQSVELGRTATLAVSAGSLTSTTVTFDSLGVANGSWNYSTAITGATATVTLSGAQLPAGQSAVLNAYKCCPNGTSCTGSSLTSSVCTTTFTSCASAASGFNVVDSYYADKGYNAAADHRIYTKLAGWSETTGVAGNTAFRLDVVALKSDGTTETNYAGSSGSKDVRLDIFDDSSGTSCNSSAGACAACSKTIVATVNPLTFAGANAGYQNDVTVSLGNTNAYSRLIARVTDTNPSPTIYACSSDAFSVRPQGFSVSATTTMSPSSGGSAATSTVKAGADFVLTANSAASGYGGTPTLVQANVSDFLGSTTPNLLTGSFGAANASGLATGTFQYAEVGYVTLAGGAIADTSFVNTLAFDSTNGDCVAGSTNNTKINGKYGCSIGNTGTSFGRFIPDHFNTVVTQVAGVPMACPDGACPTTYNGMVYSGQPFSVTVTAKNVSDGTTANYKASNGYAKTTTLTPYGALGTTTAVAGAGAIGVGSVTAFLNGTLTEAAQKYTFSTALTAPTNVYINASDGEADSRRATNPTTTSVEGGVRIASGRIRISNVYGSERLLLPVTAIVEYYNGVNWVTSSTDSVSSFVLGTPIIVTGPLTVAGLTETIAADACASSVFCAGQKKTNLDSHNVTGGATFTLIAPSWLPNSGARVTFGQYKSPLIYRRENY